MLKGNLQHCTWVPLAAHSVEISPINKCMLVPDFAALLGSCELAVSGHSPSTLLSKQDGFAFFKKDGMEVLLPPE